MNGESRHRAVLRRMRPGLGTLVEIGCAGGPAAAAATEAAYRSVAAVERRLSFQDPDSELSRLNRAGGRAVELSPTALRVLRLALAMGESSGGRFNCTIGGALVERGALPDHGGAAARPAGVASDVVVSGRSVRLRRSVLLTLDGIAKGYAIDLAVASLRRHGVAWGWVNAGGDLRVFGDVVLPVHRRETGGSVRRLGGLHRAALATSGGAGAFDPAAPGLVLSADGARVPSGTWSVLARRAWRADALTKVAALVPPDARPALVARLGGAWVDSDGTRS